jgi:hypothetical protein
VFDALMATALKHVEETDEVRVDIGVSVLSEYRTPARAARWPE